MTVVGGWLTAANPGTRIGYALLMAAIVAVALLSRRYKGVGRAIDTVFAGYLSFALSLLLALMRVVVFGWISRLILERLPPVFQIGAFTVWGLILAVALWLISTETRRSALFERLGAIGPLAPLAYAFNLLWTAVMFFSSVTFLLAQQGLLAFDPGPRGPITAGRVADFYPWHFLEAIPVLEVNQTLRWTEPLTYGRTSVGWLLLLFKLAVIVPVIAAFLGYWTYRMQR
jgi:hypothetical protein